jgi:hypothetical protein
VEHLVVLGLLGIALTELAQHNFQKIPFTCSYLPGKSNLHITFALCLLLGVNAVYWSADIEYTALSDGGASYVRLIAVLLLAAAFAWWRRARASGHAEIRFEEELTPAVSGLQLHRDGVLPAS